MIVIYSVDPEHKFGIFGIIQELFLTVVVLMSTFKNKNSLRKNN